MPNRMIACLLALFLPFSASAAEFEAGKDYLTIRPAQPTNDPARIEVVEMFWYGCPHCFQLEPLIEEWAAKLPDDVNFLRVPAVLSPRWELLAKAWYTAELLGVTDRIHKALFDEIHVKRKRINSEPALRSFFVQQGVKGEDFDNTFNSFGVAAKVNRARQLTRNYGIRGVPSMIVEGRYRTSATEAGSHERMLEVVDYLVEQARKQR
ncbi:thiol:disulfide interchange protein DsbA/DsbL [Thiohalobacter sp.]|uniref:thiol:disulfide interchange protein DsbA/DsbL n=1 Tax=Thiohalobacter sp. TaxID=2025948 RepID=UPI00261E1063|nr:thiol:disulfide interchange protein DsbA/DsbL [Thiohalobacter sp.]